MSLLDQLLFTLQHFDVAFNYVLEAYPFVIYSLYFAFAAAIGSFLGCCFYRIPRKMSLLNPKRSFCPNCKTELTFLDLVPVFSYLFLRAKCRHCSVKIAPTYFVIEILTIIIFFVFISY